MFRNAVRTALVVIPLVAVLACQKQETAATQTTTAGPPTVTVDIMLIGLDTIADRSYTPGESAAKTIILANHSTQNHRAEFLVPEATIVDPNKTGFHSVNKENNIPYWGFYLDGMQIVIDDPNANYGGTSPLTFSNAGDASNDRFPKLGQNEKSLHWVPGMGHIVSGLTTNPNYFAKEPDAKYVSARMALPGGELAPILKPPYWVWKLAYGSNPQTQVVGDEIHYTFPLKDSNQYLSVYGRKFGDKSTTKLFDLKPADPNIPLIKFYLANIPESDFGKLTTLKVGYVDPHFALHYDMLDGNPPRYDPVITGSVQKPPHPVGVGVYCGPDTIP